MQVKTHLYFVPGLAASPKIFEYITLPEALFELHFLAWKIPLSIEESIESYAKRMCEEIRHPNPVLIGVSFGGIMVQEMSKHITCKKVILISSIKNNTELPKRFKIVQATKIYKLFPAKFFANIEDYTAYFLGDYLKKRAKLYELYLSVRNPMYLHWAIYHVLHWQQTESLNNIAHIHGIDDPVFPIKNIKNCIEIKDGTHAMILMKAKQISKHILEILTC